MLPAELKFPCNNAVAIAMTKAEIQNLRLLKQQGQDVDDKIKAATQRLSSLQTQSSNAGINAGRKQVVNTLRNGVNSIGGAPINDATLKYVADKIAKGGQDYIDGMKRQATILEKRGMVTKTVTRSDSQGNSYETQVQVFDINALTKEQQKQYAIAKVVTERETKIQEGLTVWSQAVNEQASNAREIFRDNRYAGLSGGGRSGGGGGSSTFDISKIAFNPKEVQKGADDANFVSPYLMMLDEIKEKILDVKDADLGSALDIPDVYQQKIKEMEKNLKAVVKSANITADVVGNIGQAFMSIEDPAAKVAGTVMQAIASVALGYAQATVNAAEMGPWAWIAFAASGLATMLATISSIHSATGYASGGEIKGNTYSGDQIPIMANAGEIILNRAQQSSLAQSITSGGGMQNINVIGKLHGTDMVLLVDRTLKTQGKELAVWGR